MRTLIIILLVLSSHSFAFADNSVDEIDPFDKNIEKTLEKFDQIYFEETGKSPFIKDIFLPTWSNCVRQSCNVWIQVVKSTQSAYLFVNGSLINSFKVSTGVPGRGTPNFDKHPNGRVYDTYSSSKFPGGDYKGLGNMPYAVFIEGGFALHGTPAGNWSKLGKKASHGCVRMHPDNARVFNRLVREYGVSQSWITIQD